MEEYLYILCCYVLPSSPIETYQSLVDAVDFLSNIMEVQDDLLILGDFNLPSLSWTQSEDCTHYVAANATSRKEILFVDNLTNSGLMQVSNVRNNLDRQLDLIFSSDADNCAVTSSNLVLSTVDSYHPPISVIFCYEHASVVFETPSRFNFRKADFVKLNDLLNNIDFNSMLNNTNDIDVLTANFYSEILGCMEQSIPYVPQRNLTAYTPWYNRELRTIRNLRNKLWQKFLRTKSDSDFSAFYNTYIRFSNLSNELYNDYIGRVQFDLISNPRCFWQFVNSKRKSDGYPTTLHFDGGSSSDPITISNGFANFFSKSFSNSDVDPDVNYFKYMDNCAQTSLNSITIDYNIVVEKINKLKDDFSCGPDGLPPIVLKNCVGSLASPLAALFQKSLSLGVFPSLWKSSFIVPIHKKGCKSEVSNYRPIAKLSCIPKLFESIVYDSLYFYCRPLFSSHQHGFLRGRSTTTNLTEFVSRTLKTIENGREMDVVATDISKAFDSISHKIILFKLKVLGFPPHFLLWIASYLRDRKYQVLFRSRISDPIIATSGVPQGSHLGPILFILTINDVERIMDTSGILVYADDMKIFSEISTLMDHQLLQNDLNRFAIWCSKNQLTLNTDKCQAITFSHKRVCLPDRDYFINDALVRRVMFIRDLGVICDRELNFRLHFENIVNRANSALGFVKRWSKEFLNPNVTRALYITFVRPLLEYGSQVWSPHHEVHINRVEAVQRRFLRFAVRGLPLTNQNSTSSYIDRLKLVNLQPLKKRRIVADIVFVHQLLSGGIDSPALLEQIHLNLNPRMLRSVPAFRLSNHGTDYGQNEPLTRMLREVNQHYDSFDYVHSKFTLKKLLYASDF